MDTDRYLDRPVSDPMCEDRSPKDLPAQIVFRAPESVESRVDLALRLGYTGVIDVFDFHGSGDARMERTTTKPFTNPS